VNYYDVLEVSPKASAEVLRAAYKSLMQRYHPDKNRDNQEATQQAARLAQAYEVLSDPAKRAAYDAQLLADAQPQLQASAQTARSATGRHRTQQPKPAQPWYVWGLLGFIVVAGGLVIVLSKPKPVPALPALEDPRLGVLDKSAASKLAPVSSPPRVGELSEAELRARTVDAFATNLSINLTPGPLERPDAKYVLTIPQLALRVNTLEHAKWVQTIELQRDIILRRLIDRLSAAHFTDLAGPGGELYLRQLVAMTVSQAIGLQEFQISPSGPVAVPASLASLDVLLPQSFTVR
jgi:hypothetical protein